MKVLYITRLPRWEATPIPLDFEFIKLLRSRGIVSEVLAPSYEGLTDHVFDGHVYGPLLPAALGDATHNEVRPTRSRTALSPARTAVPAVRAAAYDGTLPSRPLRRDPRALATATPCLASWPVAVPCPLIASFTGPS